MELAIYFANPDPLFDLEETLHHLDPEAIPSFMATAFFTDDVSMREYYGHLVALTWFERHCAAGNKVSRLYFGQEFCEYLMPSPEELERAFYFARQMEWDFTYVTGCLTDAGLDKVRTNLERLAELTDGEGCEVVVSDWGVLRVVNHEFPVFQPLLGRLQTKQMRFPRHTSEATPPPVNMEGISVSEAEIREHQWEAFRGLNLSIPEYREQLRNSGVGRVEIDIVPQGVELPAGAWGFGVSCYYPWGYVCGGRNCLTAAAQDPERESVAVDQPCPQLCRRINRSAVLSHLPDSILQRGNSVFMLHSQYAMPYLQGHIPVDRVVFQPYVPIG